MGEYKDIVLQQYQFPYHFHSDFQMSVDEFDYLRELLTCKQKQNTYHSKSIPAEPYVTICLQWVPREYTCAIS